MREDKFGGEEEEEEEEVTGKRRLLFQREWRKRAYFTGCCRTPPPRLANGPGWIIYEELCREKWDFCDCGDTSIHHDKVVVDFELMPVQCSSWRIHHYSISTPYNSVTPWYVFVVILCYIISRWLSSLSWKRWMFTCCLVIICLFTV